MQFVKQEIFVHFTLKLRCIAVLSAGFHGVCIETIDTDAIKQFCFVREREKEIKKKCHKGNRIRSRTIDLSSFSSAFRFECVWRTVSFYGGCRSTTGWRPKPCRSNFSKRIKLMLHLNASTDAAIHPSSRKWFHRFELNAAPIDDRSVSHELRVEPMSFMWISTGTAIHPFRYWNIEFLCHRRALGRMWNAQFINWMLIEFGLTVKLMFELPNCAQRKWNFDSFCPCLDVGHFLTNLAERWSLFAWHAHSKRSHAQSKGGGRSGSGDWDRRIRKTFFQSWITTSTSGSRH